MNVIEQTLAGITIGGAVQHGNLAMFPLLGGGAGEPGYLTLDEALGLGVAKMTEAGGGSVPELEFVNEGERRVLLLDGEELLGALQNRVLNLTVLAPAKRTLK